MKTLQLTLPTVQRSFVNQFDGTLESVLNFEKLHLILNPSYSAHYFYLGGTTPENTITTKSTDGSFAYWGTQTEEQMNNSYLLASELKKFILSFNPQKLEDVVNGNHDEMRKFGKISNVKNRAAFFINGEIKLVSGLKL